MTIRRRCGRRRGGRPPAHTWPECVVSRAQGTFMPPAIVLVGILMGAADGLKFMHDNKCASPPSPTPIHHPYPRVLAPAAGSTGTSSPRISAPRSSQSSRSGPCRAMEVCALLRHARRRAPLFGRASHRAIIAAVVFDFGMSVHFESATDQKDIPAKGTPAFLPPVYTDADNKEVLEDKVKGMTLAKGKQADCHAFGISLQQILEAQTSDRKPRPPSLRPPVATLWGAAARACIL